MQVSLLFQHFIWGRRLFGLRGPCGCPISNILGIVFLTCVVTGLNFLWRALRRDTGYTCATFARPSSSLFNH